MKTLINKLFRLNIDIDYIKNNIKESIDKELTDYLEYIIKL